MLSLPVDDDFISGLEDFSSYASLVSKIDCISQNTRLDNEKIEEELQKDSSERLLTE